MIDRPMHKVLRWIYFVLGIGALASAGIYFEKAMSEWGSAPSLLRSLMFLLLGLFFIHTISVEQT